MNQELYYRNVNNGVCHEKSNEMWDDLIEWEACQSALSEVSSLLERINAEDIEVR